MSNTYRFEVTTTEKFPVRKTFMEAWDDMFQWVEKQLASGGLSYQVLETAIWILIHDDGYIGPMYFYDARDHAIDAYGWVHNKKKS